MVLLEISIETRVIIGISAMVLLFSSFLVAFISNQRKKLQYHKDLQELNAQQQEYLKEQNALLEQRVAERTIELSSQKDALQIALAELKSSQQLLIQKEKMASLGELTAGIAHEIQNPLNFVNNFAEVNIELLAELKETLNELSVSGKEDIQLLANDIIENLNKILLHGKRADSIVKNMLQHSRKQSGEMELTSLNELADEYLKLSYHGYRAKNKAFNCTIRTSFDESIGRISLIPQDIGRVLINLFNNAFYSTNEKKKKIGESFAPAISLTTQKKDNKILLVIQDNGLGIPQKIIDKIYQPFFTTKPTGEGTGLGLSMSYDIIKVHSGEMRVDSTEGEFANFTIELNA